MTFNEEDFEYLKSVEFHLGTAINSNYCRINNANCLSRLAAIYNRTIGNSRIIGGCSKCILTDIKRLGNLYFAQKKEMEAAKVEIEKPVEPKTSPMDLIQPECATTSTLKEEKPAKAKKTTKNKKK